VLNPKDFIARIDLLTKGQDFAIAFSGGGDSTALLHLLKDHPRARTALIVDHGLRRGSQDEAQQARAFAQACGYEAHILVWTPQKSLAALQERARIARYGLMGEFCRNNSITSLLTAHTQDDQAETLLMRYERQTDWRGAAGMAEKTYAPLWPELALVNLLRPLLDVRRQDLRLYNQARQITWIDDPSNENRNFARIRARDTLMTTPALRRCLLEPVSDLQSGIRAEKIRLREWAADNLTLNDVGYADLKAIPPPQLLAHLLRIISGTGGPIDRQRLSRLRRSMRDPDFKAATLAGAQIVKSAQAYVITRDLAIVKGRANSKRQLQPLTLRNDTIMWDGRFIITVGDMPIRLIPAMGMGAQLRRRDKARFQAIPPAVRPSTPLALDDQGAIVLMGGGLTRAVEIKPVAALRLAALLAG